MNHEIFKATDVVKIDDSPVGFNTPAVKIIRLKGPHDYDQEFHPIDNGPISDEFWHS